MRRILQNAARFRLLMGMGQEENLFTPDGGQAQGEVLLLQVDLQFFLQAGKTIPLKNRFLLEQIRLQGR